MRDRPNKSPDDDLRVTRRRAPEKDDAIGYVAVTHSLAPDLDDLYRFAVSEKHGKRMVRTKTATVEQYGGAGAEVPTDRGQLYGDVLTLLNRRRLVYGRGSTPVDDAVPELVTDGLTDRGAFAVRGPEGRELVTTDRYAEIRRQRA